MLTIQPGFTNTFNRVQSFGNRYRDDEYVDYEEVTDSFESSDDDFNIAREKAETKKELDLWRQTKANVESIARTTEAVPGMKTGTKVLSGLTTVAIGWGGLRWGTVGTLEVMSKVAETGLVKGAKTHLGEAYEWAGRKLGALGNYAKETGMYKSAAAKLTEWQTSFLDTSVGKNLTNFKNTVKENNIYKDIVKMKNDGIEYVRNLNYKRVFVEGMGVAGGGTAAINVLGGKPVDGREQMVEADDDGRYYVDGYEEDFERGYSDVA